MFVLETNVTYLFNYIFECCIITTIVGNKFEFFFLLESQLRTARDERNGYCRYTLIIKKFDNIVYYYRSSAGDLSTAIFEISQIFAVYY